MSGSFVCFRWVQGEERESGSGSNGTCCLVLFFLPCFLLFSYFSLPAGLMPVSSSSSSCCFVRAAVVCSSEARTLFFLQPFWSSCITLLSGFSVFLVLIFLIFSSGLFCCSLWPGTPAFHLPYVDNCDYLGFSLSHGLWPHNLYLSRMNNQHGHWVHWCRWVERTV